MVIASANPVVFSAGADIKAFTQMDEGSEDLIHSGHALLRDLGSSRVSTVAAVNALAFGGGCELAMACDFRIAAESAVFGQPEIKLGIIPGFGGTQRLPRLVGPDKALEMNLVGDAITAGEALRVRPRHPRGPRPGAVRHGARCGPASSPARRRSRSSRSRRSPTRAISTRASRPRSRASPPRSPTEDAKEGISAFLGKRTPKWQGK